jgi:hypothetical protein
MKGRLGRAALVLGVLLTTLAYPLLAPPAHRIDRGHLALITPGMTEADVEGILGVPAGDYDWVVQDEKMRIEVLIGVNSEIFDKVGIHQLAFSGRAMIVSAQHRRGRGMMTYKTWSSRHGVFHVAFNEDGGVAATGMWGEVRPFWRVWWEKLAGK